MSVVISWFLTSFELLCYPSLSVPTFSFDLLTGISIGQTAKHAERIIGISPILGVAKLRYSIILEINPLLYGDYHNKQCRHQHTCTVWDKSPESQNTLTLQYHVYKKLL